MKTRWGIHLSKLCSNNKRTLTDLALCAKCSGGLLSRYISGRLDRPTPEILKAVGACWTRPEQVELVAEHLHDEICRAGLLDNEFVINTNALSHQPDDLVENLDALKVLAQQNRPVRILLADLRVVLEGAVRRGHFDQHLKVAEQKATYTKAKDK